MGKKDFVTIALDPEHKIFVVYVVFLSSNPLDANVYHSHGLQIAGLIAKKTFTKVFIKYIDFTDIFSLDLASKLPKHIGINDYTIKLVNSRQLLYEPIYSLGPMKLKTLKAYIKINLANRFIRLSKSSTGAPIFFDQKPDKLLQLCVNYKNLKNFMIKN